MPNEYANLRNEAIMFKQQKLWKVLRMDIKYNLGKKMFEEARCNEDILWGQLLTFLDDIIQTRIKQLTK